VGPIVSWPFVLWKRPRCGACAAGCATALCGSLMPSSMAVSTGCYCRRCVGLRKGEPSSTGRHLPARADPFIERVLAQIGSGCESLNPALSAEELMISPRGHVILRDDPAVTSERSDAELVRNQLYARVGRAQLTELLLAVDGETHFPWELLRRAPGLAPRG
jgi:hypothetical protein